MARFAYIVVPMPDDAPLDVNELAARLNVGYDTAPGDEYADIADLFFVAYSNHADLIRDQLEGCATNGFWLGHELDEPAPVPAMAVA